MTQKMRDALHELCLADRDVPDVCIPINVRIAAALSRLGYVVMLEEAETPFCGSVICGLPDRDGSRGETYNRGGTYQGSFGESCKTYD